MPMIETTLADGSTRIGSIGGTDAAVEELVKVSKNRVIEGLIVTASATPDTNVSVSAGTVMLNNVWTRIAAGTVACGGAHATLGRKDIIEVDATGIYFKLGAAASSSVEPNTTDGRIRIATVTRAAGDNAVGSGDIDNGTRPRYGNTYTAVG